MSQRGKRPNNNNNNHQKAAGAAAAVEDGAPPVKRRKGRPPGSGSKNHLVATNSGTGAGGAGGGGGGGGNGGGSSTTNDHHHHHHHDDAPQTYAAASSWQPKNPDMKGIYNRSAPEAPAELFRKDLISAMKLPDSEPLSTDAYWLIVDQWKQEWERGVQVPVNPDSLPEARVNSIADGYIQRGRQDFKLPKNKYIRITKDDSFSHEQHYLSHTPAMAESVCAYDLDQLDEEWLKRCNGERALCGLNSISDEQFERVIEELEVRCWDKIQAIMKNEEGLGIEYDENVICDVCRSPDSEEANEMVFCDSCNICVHQACYGITTIPPGQWLCRTCSLPNKNVKPDCILCPNKGGAMKSTRTGSKWAHVSCALWIPEVSIGSVDRMEPITKISNIPSSRWALNCVLCRERVGACIQCSVKTCKIAYHVTCAFQHGLEMRAIIEDEQNEDGVKLRSYCQKHSNVKNSKKEAANSGNSTASGNKVATGSGSDEEDGKRTRKTRRDMTTEERNQVRAQRMAEVQAEFDKHVNIKDISCHLLDIDQEGINYIYNYWILKRKSGKNRPLLPPKNEDAESPKTEHNQEHAKMRMFVQLRQDLERVRNLCYMVSRREKLSRSFFKMREQTFHKQVSILTECRNSKQRVDEPFLTAVIEANHGPSIYDRLYSSDSVKFSEVHNIDVMVDRLVSSDFSSNSSNSDSNKLKALKGDERRRDNLENSNLSLHKSTRKLDINGINNNKKNLKHSASTVAASQSSENHSDNPYKRTYFNGTTTSRRSASLYSSSGVSDKSASSAASSEDEKESRVPSAKNASSNTTARERKQKRKVAPKSAAVVDSSSEDDSRRSPRNRTLQQMEKELQIERQHLSESSDDSEELNNICAKPGSSNKMPTNIYSDSDSTDKDQAASDSQPFRTKAAMKEFNVKMKTPSPKESKGVRPDILVVPQRQAAKKASESLKRTPVQTTPVQQPGKDEVLKEKDQIKERKREEVPFDIHAFVPQRQAAKKAAEHIKSVIKPAEVVQPTLPLIPVEQKKLKPEPKKDSSSSGSESSSSGSSSSSNSSSSSSSSEDSEPDKSGKKIAKNRVVDKPVLPFLDKGNKSGTVFRSSSDSSEGSSTESDGSNDVPQTQTPQTKGTNVGHAKARVGRRPSTNAPSNSASNTMGTSGSSGTGRPRGRPRTKSIAVEKEPSAVAAPGNARRGSKQGIEDASVSNRRRTSDTSSGIDSTTSRNKQQKTRRNSIITQDSTDLSSTTGATKAFTTDTTPRQRKQQSLSSSSSSEISPNLSSPHSHRKHVGTEDGIATNSTNDKASLVSPSKREKDEIKLRQKQERERMEKEKQEREVQERHERMEKERLERERQEKERAERLERERQERVRIERETAEKLERERLEQERLRREQEEWERAERERSEKERLERERIEKERLEQERLDRLERERIERERLERERLERERIERLERERLEQEQLERERLELERLEQLERERLEQERLERERLEKIRLEKERLEKERLEKERLERERLQRLEQERIEKEKELARLEMERIERERIEKEKRLERERLEREQREAIEKEKQRLEKEKEDRERKDAERKRRKEEKERKKRSSSDMEIEPPFSPKLLPHKTNGPSIFDIGDETGENNDHAFDIPQTPLAFTSNDWMRNDIEDTEQATLDLVEKLRQNKHRKQQQQEENKNESNNSRDIPEVIFDRPNDKNFSQSAGLITIKKNDIGQPSMHELQRRYNESEMITRRRSVSSSPASTVSDNNENQHFQQKLIDERFPHNPNLFFNPSSSKPTSGLQLSPPYPVPRVGVHPLNRPAKEDTFKPTFKPPTCPLIDEREVPLTNSLDNAQIQNACLLEMDKKSPKNKSYRHNIENVQTQALRSPLSTKSPGRSPRQLDTAHKQVTKGANKALPEPRSRNRSNSTKSQSANNSKGKSRNSQKGRQRNPLQIPIAESEFGSTNHNNLAGTVYDLDWEEDTHSVPLQKFRTCQRDRRKSNETHEFLRSRGPSESPKFSSPKNRSLYSSAANTPTSDARRTPHHLLAPESQASALQSSSLHDSLMPVLPVPVDMRTYSNFDATNTEMYNNHLLGAFDSGTADHTIPEIDEDLERDFQSALKASSSKPDQQQGSQEQGANNVAPHREPPSEDVSVDSDSIKVLPDSRNQLKLKIKGPLAPDGYSQRVTEQTVVASVATPSIGGLRRMRKKELLRQYWTQDANMDDQQTTSESNQSVPSSLPTSRGIPKAVDSMSSIPTKEDYKDYTAADMKKRKKVSNLQRELRQLSNDVDDAQERRRSIASDKSSNASTSGRKVKSSSQNSTPKLRIKIGADIISEPTGNVLNEETKPPKKRPENTVGYTMEDLKRDSLNYRKEMFANFGKEKKEKVAAPERLQPKKKKKEKKRKVEVIESNQSFVLKIKRPKIDSNPGPSTANLDEAPAAQQPPQPPPPETPAAVPPAPIKLKLARTSGTDYALQKERPSKKKNATEKENKKTKTKGAKNALKDTPEIAMKALTQCRLEIPKLDEKTIQKFSGHVFASMATDDVDMNDAGDSEPTNKNDNTQPTNNDTNSETIAAPEDPIQTR